MALQGPSTGEQYSLGGAGQIPEALGQDRCGSFLPINRYFFCFFAASPPKSSIGFVCRMLDQSHGSMSSSWSLGRQD
jgi:hypothetical protein